MRTDSLKGRRGRLPSKPKVVQEVTTTVSPVSMIASLVRGAHRLKPWHWETWLFQGKKTETTSVLLLFLGNNWFMHPSKRLCCNFSMKRRRSVRTRKRTLDDIKQFYHLLTSSMEVVRKWAKSIPGFCDFCSEDQDLLLESAFVELFILRLAYRWVQQTDTILIQQTSLGHWITKLCIFFFQRSNPEKDKLIFCNGSVLHKTQCVRGFGDWIDSILEFSQSLHRMKLDVSSFSCLTALVLITGKRLTPYQALTSGPEVAHRLWEQFAGGIWFHCCGQNNAVTHYGIDATGV